VEARFRRVGYYIVVRRRRRALEVVELGESDPELARRGLADLRGCDIARP
jgi:hypothetical protein